MLEGSGALVSSVIVGVTNPLCGVILTITTKIYGIFLS